MRAHTLLVLNLIGTFVFALSAAVAGVGERLDLFGVLVLSFAAASPEKGEFPEDVHLPIVQLMKKLVRGGLVDGPIAAKTYNSLRGLHLNQPVRRPFPRKKRDKKASVAPRHHHLRRDADLSEPLD